MEQPTHHLFSKSMVKVTYADLKAKGVVRHRRDLFLQIKAGRLPKPHKNSDYERSGAWWYADEIDAALLREREQIAGSADH